MKKKQQPKFYALDKDFNDGKVKPYEVLGVVFNSILNSKGNIKKKDFCVYDKNWKRVAVRTKKQCQEYIEDIFRYYYWAKCEWEFIAIDWPYGDSIETSRPVKVDVFDQLKPNIPVITDLVWDYIEDKVNKLIEKENE